MVVREQMKIKEKQYIKNYSDRRMYIERDGVKYEEAIDPIEYAEERIYTESDEPIEEEVEEE